MSIENALLNLVEELEPDRLLGEPRHLRQRVEALDSLDVLLSDGQPIGKTIRDRATALCAQLESVNFKLYEEIRQDIRRGAGGQALREWMSSCNHEGALENSNGYDYLDELVSGVLQFEEPSGEIVRLEQEMVPYQPTPARHIFDFINRTDLTEKDFLIDLGSGLGQVTLIAAICTGANCTGIELEPAYVECARKSARSLKLNNAAFIQGDVRAADLSVGTIFYLFTPFTGAILRDVLKSLRDESAKREIRVCTFGPCTPVVAEEKWLIADAPAESHRVAILSSRAASAKSLG
jgi:SAM-dependent methyltransferase